METFESKINEPEINRENVINISSKGETDSERMLSNFAHAPFELDGKHYESVEAFWQSIKFPEQSKERERVAKLFGGEAKRAGRRAGKIDKIEYGGKDIQIGSAEHHEIMKRAIRAKLEQNPHVLQLLLDTGNKKITHILKTPDGRTLPDSKTIPGAIFSQILMDLREEFRRKIWEESK